MSTTDALVESLKQSRIPFIHEFLIKFPHPLISWSEVITTRPNITHFYWIVIFIFITGFTHLICHLFGHAFARRLIGWKIDPPLPTTNIMKSSNFLKLGQIVRHRKHIKMSNLDLKQISIETDLTTKEIKKCIAFWNRFHAENRCQRRKLQEYLFPIIYKSFAFYLGCYLFYDKPWIYDSSLYFKGWPFEQQLQYSADIKFVYLTHIGWYFYGCFSHSIRLLFGNTLHSHHIRKDTMVTLIHHFSATFLITLSYGLFFTRIGIVVLLLHHPSDIALQSAKFWSILKVNFLCNLFFALLCITWLSTRIFIYPYHCIYKTLQYWPSAEQTMSIDGIAGSDDLHHFIIALLCIIYILHLYWFNILLGSLIRLFRGKQLKDYSEI